MSTLSVERLLELIGQRSNRPGTITYIDFIPNNYAHNRNLEELTPAGRLQALGLLPSDRTTFTDFSDTPGSLNPPMPNIPDFMQDRVAQWQGWPRPWPQNIRRRHLRELRGPARTQNPAWPCWTCRHKRIVDFLDSGTEIAQPG